MSAEIGDLQRRMANVFRIGKVAEVDYQQGRVKVSFEGATSAWLPWMASRAGAVKDWNPPSIGEQVCICSPSGEIEAGFIMPGSINTTASAPPSNQAGAYVLEVPAGGSFEVRCGGASLKLSGGKLTLSGDIEVTGDVKAGAISLKTHKHGGVASGGSQTGTPA